MFVLLLWSVLSMMMMDIDVFIQYIFDTLALFAPQVTINNSTYSY